MTDINIKQFKGESQDLTFTVNDDDGNAIDLTSSNVQDAHLDVATGLAAYGETKLEKTGSNYDSNGNTDFSITPSDTENLRPGIYLYEVWVEFDSQENYTSEVGKFFVKPRVDR